MDPAIYGQKRATGEIPDVLEVDARLDTSRGEDFESICERPPVPYLNKLNEELEKLGQIAHLPDNVHDTIHIRPDFLAKYGIDRKASSKSVPPRLKRHIGNLDARFVRMTGRRPYADELFNGMKKRQSDSSEERPSLKAAYPTEAQIKRSQDGTMIKYSPFNCKSMRLKIFMLCLVALFVSQTSRAQWGGDRPRQPRTRHHQCHEEHRAYILYGK